MGAFGSGAFGAGPFSGFSFENDIKDFTTKPLILVEIQFTDETRYFASTDVRFVEQFYNGKITSVSSLRRSIQQNLGIYEISSIDLTLADTDRSLVTLASTTNMKGITATFKIGTKRIPLGSFVKFAEGKVDDFGSENFNFKILVRDRLWTLPAKPITGTVNETDFPNALPAHFGKPLPLCYGRHESIDETDARNRGSWPTLFVDNRTAERVFLIARHAIKSVDTVYAYTPGRGSLEMTETTHYTVHKADLLNGETMAYIKITALGWSDFVTDTAGNFGEVTCNVQGKETLGNGSGDLIENPINVLEDLFDNYLGDPPVNGTTFDAARTTARTRGYITAGGLVTDVNTDALLQAFAASFNIRIYPDKDGAIAVNIFSPPAPTVVVEEVSENWDVLQGSFGIDFTADVQGAEDTQVINKVEYENNFHWAKGFYEASDSVSDSTSISTYGESVLKLSIPWNRTTSSAKDVAQRMMFLYADPVANVTLTMPLRGVLLDLTEQISLTHAGGHVSGGYVDRRFEIIEHSLDPNSFTTALRAKDVEKLVANAIFLNDSDAYSESTGTAGVVNTDATVTITAGPADLSAEIQVGDICWFDDPPTPAPNQRHFKVAAPITATTFEAEDTNGNPITSWATEGSISYKIVRSVLTADATLRKWYGFMCDDTTEQFSDSTAGKQLK